MGAVLFVDMSKSKSFLRSSSGTSYPYPRTHTTLMVVPSTRPIGPEDTTTVRKQASRRRPPLNRSIPPIPESKSNESIMSHASRRSSDKSEHPQPSGCVVIENRNALEQLQRLPKSVNSVIPRPSRTKKLTEQKKEEKSSRTETPRSPLMTVARTVKNKFSKLTRMGRHEQDVSMKGSQSFSGIRQPKSALPKRIDQNANRVIKSSSMEVPSTSQEPTTSKHMVVIPQSAKRLEDFSEEASLADQGKAEEDVLMEEVRGAAPSVKPTERQPEIRHQELSVTLNEDVLMVTKQLDDFADPREDTVVAHPEGKRGATTEGAAISKRHQVTHTSDDYSQESTPLPQPHSGVLKSTQVTFAIDEKPSVSFGESEEVQRPCTYTCAREHRTFALGEKIPDTSSMLRAPEQSVNGEHHEEKVVMTRELSPPPRFLMSVKTPEAMRKHQSFVVSLADCKATLVGTPVISSPKKKKKVKIIKQRSMPERSVSPDRYILKVKTPEALRRHHTFTIRERARSPDVPYIEDGEITEPIATVGPSAEKMKKQKEDTEKRLAEEEPVQEKYTMSVRTPFTLRKFNTFVVEEKSKDDAVPCSKSADTLVHAKVTEAVASPSPSEKQRAPDTDLVEDSHEKFILSTTSTAATMRKFQTFVIEDRQQKTQPMKSHTTDNVEAIARLGGQEEESEHDVPLKTSDMYVLTTMTPLPQRKGTHLERIAKEKSRSASRSPDKVSLFVLGGRTAPRSLQNEDSTLKCATVQPQMDLDTPRRDRSQSDRAEFVERKNSASSGEMTSPEEEIPMDTHLTPTEEVHHDEMLITRAIRRPAAEVTSPIAEESEASVGESPFVTMRTTAVYTQSEAPSTDPPVFRPPSPPSEEFKAITLSKSTSPLRRRGSTEAAVAATKEEKKRGKLSFRSKSEDRREKKMEERERLKREKREEKERTPRSPKMPITARSLRSAGKMLAPAFFRRAVDPKIPKPAKPVPIPSPMPMSKTRMHLPFRSGRKAPLAEFESSVVEDSPAVENNPLTFEKWSNSPRGKRRHSAHLNGFAEPIAEESDGNGNVCSTTTAPGSSRVECAMSPAMTRHEPAPGLIDDEILDQPMLVGDTFSHSDSNDCLSAVRRMEFEAEKATLISIDRSLIEDSDSLPRRTFDNGNGPASNTTRAATVFATPPATYRKALEDGLSEVDDIRSQLEKLQFLVAQEMRGTDVEKLVRENEELRRELLAKDELISALRQQIASQRS